MLEFLFRKNTREQPVDLTVLEDRLEHLSPTNRRERFAHAVCELALQARQAGNYGVGAVLCLQDEILYSAKNAVFFPVRDSSAHAEMQLLDQWEQGGRSFKGVSDNSELTLICSLEPCPMCLSRILMSGVTRILYLAEDRQGGMLTRANKLPPAFRNLLHRCEVGPLLVDKKYRDLAKELAQHGIAELRNRLMS